MKNKSFFTVLFICLLLVSCQNNKQVHFIKADELVFDTDFKPSFFNSGRFYDKKTIKSSFILLMCVPLKN